jgi:hypothetical protein
MRKRPFVHWGWRKHPHPDAIMVAVDQGAGGDGTVVSLARFKARAEGAGHQQPPVTDSLEGMTILAAWARTNGVVLSEAHERMAKKHGISLDGITISRLLSR